MDINRLSVSLESKGFKNSVPGAHFGVDFEIVGWRKSYGADSYALIKYIPLLDDKAGMVWSIRLKQIEDKSKSGFLAKVFCICLIAEEVLPAGLMLLIEGKFGKLIVVDIENKIVHGNVPSIPLAIHSLKKDLMEVVSDFSLY